jgi:hypothetical protein
MHVKNNLTYQLNPRAFLMELRIGGKLVTKLFPLFARLKPKKAVGYFTFLFMFTLLLIDGPVASGQQVDLSKPVSLNYQDISLPSLIDSITSKVSIKFSYNTALFKNKKIENIHFNNLPLRAVLDSLVKQFSIAYTVVENHVVFHGQYEIPAFKTGKTFTKTIKGTILNDRTGKPVEYANISISGKPMGTISNSTGEFIFKFANFHESSKIVISAIGYANYTKTVREIKDTPLLVRLQPISLPIEEITIYAVDPVYTIRRLIENINQNYHESFLLQTAFYRETIKEDDDYVGIHEAVVKILNPPVTHSLANEKISVFKARKSTDVKIMDTIDFKFQGGIYNSLALDVVGERISFLDGASMHLYDYTYTGLEVEDERYSFIIEFNQKARVKEPLYSGKLWIDANTYGLNRAMFSISNHGIQYARDLLVKKYSRNLRIRPLSVNYRVDYEFINGKWQLKHVKSELEIRVRKKGALFGNTYSAIAEMVITDFSTVNRKEVKFDHKVRPTDILSEEIEGYDPEFWGPYNYLQPGESLEKSFERIRRKIEGKQ